MKKYKIEISINKVFNVEAENTQEAKENAKLAFHEKVRSGDYYIESKEFKEPINWYNEAKETAENILEEYKEEFTEFIKNSKQDTTQDIYEDLYETKDLVDICHKRCDGRFIYNDSESIKEAINCINELNEYKELDEDLWEGLETIKKIINAKAFWTFRNAVITLLGNNLKDQFIDDIIAEKQKDEKNKEQ